MGVGFLIGHAALAVLMPVALLALVYGYQSHRQPVALGLGALAVGIAYVHIFAETPEWTLYLVLVASVLAAFMDWRAARSRPSRWSAALFSQVRTL